MSFILCQNLNVINLESFANCHLFLCFRYHFVLFCLKSCESLHCSPTLPTFFHHYCSSDQCLSPFLKFIIWANIFRAKKSKLRQVPSCGRDHKFVDLISIKVFPSFTQNHERNSNICPSKPSQNFTRSQKCTKSIHKCFMGLSC